MLQSHLKDIQSAFVSILSDSDGKYYCILSIVCFGGPPSDWRESWNRQKVNYTLSALKDDCRNFPFLTLIGVISRHHMQR